MRFLNPKTDLAFKKIFGSDSSHEIVISFLNAMLSLTGDDTIADVTILDPYQAPKIQGMKDTFLDVRVRDISGRTYVVEMQVLNVPGFEKRVLYNACKAYVGQLFKGDGYHLLGEVVAITITDFIMFPELARVVSQFRLRADENPLIHHQDLELVFAELPKFTKNEAELESTLDRWLYFLKSAGDLTTVPRALAVEPAIVKALDIVNRAAWTDDELDSQEKRQMWISEQIYLQNIVKDTLDKAKRIQDENTQARQENTQARQENTQARQENTQARQENTQARQENTQARQENTQARQENTQARQEIERARQENTQARQEIERARQEIERMAQEAERMAQEAEQHSETKGKAEMLLRLLRRRFGALSTEIESRVLSTSSEQLDEWSERFVDAHGLADVFDTATQH